MVFVFVVLRCDVWMRCDVCMRLVFWLRFDVFGRFGRVLLVGFGFGFETDDRGGV